MWEPDSKQESGKECLRRIFYFVKSSEMKKVLEEIVLRYVDRYVDGPAEI